MLNECIEYLNIKPDGIYVDGTIGGAGHSSEIVKHLSDKGLLIGIDRDEEALNASRKRLSEYSNVKYVWGRHEDIKRHVEGLGIEKIDGVLLDLGVSSYQIDEASRGFSYTKNAMLDMRMNQCQELTAKDVVNTYSKEQLENIFNEYGEEKFSRRIAEKIVERRKESEICTTYELADIIRTAVSKDAIDSFKRIFQALRIEVNGELKELYNAIKDISSILNDKGRICIITFHSLEDRIVKNIFKEKTKIDSRVKGLPNIPDEYLPDFRLVNNKAIVPSLEELENNNRARSSKLRVIERIK